MSILQIITHVKEHYIPGTFDCISKETNTQNCNIMYIYANACCCNDDPSTGANKCFQTGT
jgi:hypothetical protein